MWKIVDIKNRRRTGEPFATIAGSRISFNSASCNLLDIKKYKFVHVLINPDEKILSQIAVQFIKENTQKSFSFRLRELEKGNINGADINSKALIEELFDTKINKESHKYSVTLENEDMLVINLKKEL